MTGWLFFFLLSECSACEMCQTDTLGTKFLCLFTDHAQGAVSLLDSQYFYVAIAFPQNIVATRSMSRIPQTRWDQITFRFLFQRSIMFAWPVSSGIGIGTRANSSESYSCIQCNLNHLVSGLSPMKSLLTTLKTWFVRTKNTDCACMKENNMCAKSRDF